MNEAAAAAAGAPMCAVPERVQSVSVWVCGSLAELTLSLRRNHRTAGSVDSCVCTE